MSATIASMKYDMQDICIRHFAVDKNLKTVSQYAYQNIINIRISICVGVADGQAKSLYR